MLTDSLPIEPRTLPITVIIILTFKIIIDKRSIVFIFRIYLTFNLDVPIEHRKKLHREQNEHCVLRFISYYYYFTINYLVITKLNTTA